MKPHALMISVPFQGHINPFLNLALKLASKGLTITFVHLQYVHRKLSEPDGIFSDARRSGLDIRYTTIGDGLADEFDRDCNPLEYWLYLFRNFGVVVDEFVGKMMMEDSEERPNVMVTDTIYHWAPTIAKKYELVNVSFWTEPALVFSLLYHVDLLKENGHFLSQDKEEANIDYIPGVKSISTKDLMSSLTDAKDESSITLFGAFKEVKNADFILHNTVQELESETLTALNKHQPNYAIGPINFSTTNTTITNSLRVESDCAAWLSSSPPGSVLYVSFGSVVQTSKHVIHEIAYGLLLSGVKFIWVVRSGVVGTADNSADDDVLPPGFEEEVKDRGLIVPWCNQIMVLMNSAIGGFLTHCGWNSMVESMWCGVPMICYPVTYDQPTNRKLVVDDWGIGVGIGDGMCIDRKEVAEKIRSVMSGDASERLRKGAKNVEHIVRSALENDGSSSRNLDRFLSDLEMKLSLQ